MTIEEMLYLEAICRGQKAFLAMKSFLLLVTKWRKGDPSALLVGMQTSAATEENSIEFPPKIKSGAAF